MLILCLGNALHGDDAAGSRVFDMLCHLNWPAGVDLLNGGASGLALLSQLEHYNSVILIDAFSGPDRAGDIMHYRDVSIPADAQCAPPEHGGCARDLLALMPLVLNRPPRVDVIGVVGQDFTAYRPGLSQAVEHSLPALCQAVYQRAGELCSTV